MSKTRIDHVVHGHCAETVGDSKITRGVRGPFRLEQKGFLEEGALELGLAVLAVWTSKGQVLQAGGGSLGKGPEAETPRNVW